MEDDIKDKLAQFRALVSKIRGYYEAVGLLNWDLRTGAPRKGAEFRSETIGMLDTEMFKLQISDEMANWLDYFSRDEIVKQLDELDRKIVQECKKEFELNKLIPANKFQEYSVLTAHAQTLWEEAKEESDFIGFEPYLSKIVALKKEFIGYWGVKGTPYDTLIDMYEPDMTVEKLDEIFNQLRKRLVPLVEAIQASPNQPEHNFLHQIFAKEQQEKFGLFILEQMGYDFEAGRQDESVHPFATGLNIGDVRITTNYIESDVTNALFSSLHEGGHALYEQNIDEKFAGTPLAEGTSMGIHESQSRLWENMIGRSRAFWERYYVDLQKQYPSQLKDVELEDFYRAINRVQNSLIRIDADELTYNLHIIIRYEIEKMLFNEDLSVKDLPEVWNAKYNEYLGITPPNDGQGVLQDVHWSGGDFGYFASYSLGNMYAAQFLNTMHKELPQFNEWIAEGNLLPIKEWLTAKIYQYGKSLTPAQIIVQVTGEELNPNYLADYLEDKYKEIYKL
ncbi:carboxypeptidase M32 [Paenibacillus crassostreae]|uniref:Metal-dependent carboxypeptidase n=1 Tax=Paenibacillus crassostreae TaxID=1763538 RepID=A0A167DRG4_9BACL|nr:carboxypeptidase M32 [Paenibacillus crassostreae]AOZ91146.1 carboxypeptidase M32 [Paenibacillus crassostreae]OAB74695.1 peptidase M32 [Paenibacillus crassostreae]